MSDKWRAILVALAVAMATATTAGAVVVVPASDPAWFWSPYNWRFAAGYAQSSGPGAYLKVGFTAAATSAAVLVDMAGTYTTGENGGSDVVCVSWSVDDGPYHTQCLTSASTRVTLDTTEWYSAGRDHKLLLQINAVQWFAATDVWSPGANTRLRVTGLELDDGASILRHPVIHNTSVLIWGDSITEGVFPVAGNPVWTTNSARDSFAVCALVPAFQAEYGHVAWGGQGWYQPGLRHVPAFTVAWNRIDAETTRVFHPEPAAVYVNLGTNDNADVAPVVTTWLTAARLALGPKPWILVGTPPSGKQAAALAAGLAAYASACHHDTKTRLADAVLDQLIRDPGTNCQDPQHLWRDGRAASVVSEDGCHPNKQAHAALCGRLAAAVRRECGTQSR